MKKSDILLKLKELRKNSPKRKFNQSIDLSIVLKNVNMKKDDEKVDEIINLPHARGKPVKVCAFVDKELATNAAKVFEKAIPMSEFPEWKDPRKCKKLAMEFDVFIAQATIMPQIAATFGKYLGTRGKMPNPKMGCIIPPSADLTALKSRLQKVVNVSAKKSPAVNVRIGMESQADEEIADNIFSVFETVKKKLPQEESQMKSVSIKMTMSPKVKLL
jgi:large subunit ribosomal protein L1